MKKCILLVRVSTLAQDLQQQTDKVREQAILDGYLSENIITIEEKESGIKLKEEERLGLNRMKQCIEADPKIDCVYIYELSRLSRRSAVLYSVREYLIERNIQLICLNPYFKMLEDGKLSESGNLLFGIFSSMSENEMAIKKGADENFRVSFAYPYPKMVHIRYIKKGMSAMPCNCALNPFILELRDSADALVDLLIK